MWGACDAVGSTPFLSRAAMLPEGNSVLGSRVFSTSLLAGPGRREAGTDSLADGDTMLTPTCAEGLGTTHAQSASGKMTSSALDHAR